MKCPSCRTSMASRRENYRYAESGLPNVTLVGIEVRQCSNCGERAAVIPRIDDLHRRIAREVIQKRGRLTAAEIRFLRKYLGWSGVDFARHMGVTPATVSRWENVEDPQAMGPVADRLLRMAVSHGRPLDEYPIEKLAEVADEEAKPTRIGLKPSRQGWEAARAA